MPMKLLIDQGNSSIKWCLALTNQHSAEGTDQTILSELTFDTRGFSPLQVSTLDTIQADILTLTEQDLPISSVWLASVKASQALEAELTSIISAEINAVTSASQFAQLTNAYADAQRLGVDRWLAMIAGRSITEQGFIVIDAGTALTLDVVDESGQHLGGHIISGLSLQQQTLVNATDKIIIRDSLLIGDTANQKLQGTLGASTEQAVAYGALSQIIAYLESMIERYPNFRVLITGGDAKLLKSQLKMSVEHLPEAVLLGLNLVSSSQSE
jgi:type III pantothenate kinase